MFLHLGGEVTVLQKEILGIFDYETVCLSQATKDYLDLASSEKKIITINGPDQVKSFVITDKNVFLSPISSITLQKRALAVLPGL